MKKILIVDDEPDILEFLKYNLEKENYLVYIANNGIEALQIAAEVLPDLFILDVMMPEMDGIETCRKLRENPKHHNKLIILLSARSEEYAQIYGLEAGADDYIIKPIKPRILISKINAFFRRTLESNEYVIKYNNITINRHEYIISINDKRIEFPKKEFELIWLLASKKGKLISREEIYKTIWGNKIIVGDRTLDVHVRKIREKLGEEIIKTVKGIGYKFEL